jgi:hypothetical protein
MALDSSYLGEIEFGPFFIEAIYDRSSTIVASCRIWQLRSCMKHLIASMRGRKGE